MGPQRSSLVAFCCVVLLMPCAVARAQGENAPATAAQPEAEKDPLGRDTPRGTVLGFMRAAGEGKTDVAQLYLNSGLSGRAATDLAQQLYVVLNSRLPVRVNVLSERPEGSLVNPLKPDQDIVGTINTSSGPLDLVLERTDGRGGRVWLFSRPTLQAVPRVYKEINLPTIDRYLPSFLTQTRIADVRLFDWLVFILGLPLLYRVMGLFGRALSPLLALLRRRLGRPDDGTVATIHGSVRLLVAAGLIRVFVLSIDLPLMERQFWAIVRAGLIITGSVWLLLLFNDFAERYVQRQAHIADFGGSVAVLRLARRVADVLVVCAGGLVALNYFGVNPTAALAGLGIGGIAVALAAQKTLENVIGGFSLVFDKALRVGDVLKLGEIVGTVDQVGLRSTRIRTVDRTVLSVPNGQISTVNIETLNVRDKFWFRHVIGLRYDTTPAQIRRIVTELNDLLKAQAGADLTSVRVRFLRLGASSLDIELVAYFFARDWDRFLEIQEALLLQIMEIVQRAGTSIAIPSQTVRLTDDRLARTAPDDVALPTVST